MSRFFRVRVRQNRLLNDRYHLLSLAIPPGARDPQPGQFYMFGVHDGLDPLLKRAFSLFRKTVDGFQVLFRVSGKGTALLGACEAGAEIEILGPLGSPYPVPARGQVPVIVAGGIGIASVFPLIESLRGTAVVFYGARTREEIVLADEIRGLSRELHVTTDDGSLGDRGTVVESLHSFLAAKREGQRCVIFSCGPKPMLQEVARLAAEFSVRSYVSLEEYMACGVGACMGCVVGIRPGSRGKGKTAYKKVCKDGPVFDASEVLWQGE